MNTDLTPAPTPQTDSTQKLWKTQIRIEEEIWDFARELERELLAAHKETAERDEALNTIADELQLSIGSTPDQIAVSVRNELARGIHTCHENCQRPYCVLKREKEALSGALREEQLKTQALGAVLAKCFHHLGREIQRNTLNETAEFGTQELSMEVAKTLDSVNV